jgi:hypothetical protein
MSLLSYDSVAALQVISMHDSIFPCFDILALLMKNMASGIGGFGGMQLKIQTNLQMEVGL